MKRLLCAALIALCAPGVFAGDAVTAFRPGKPPPPEALQHVAVKAVVAEFLDADATALGKELGYLVWREILTAISDQRGAGVIIAHPPGNERLVELLRQSYHQAALQIAESQKARMAIWGAVSEQDGRVAVDTYLSLLGEATREELALKVSWAERPGQAARDSGLAARISRTRFNFTRVWTTREALFTRPLLVQRNNTAVRERPAAGKTLHRAAAGETLEADGMQGEWFQVRLRDGARGYVRSWDVHVPPRRIEALRDEPLREHPAPKARRVGGAGANASYAVLASRYVAGSGLWYRVAAPDGKGWIRGAAVRTQFSFPVVHFAAGLYRYQLGRYADAAREFEQFTRVADAAADPPGVSSAYQLLGASRLMQGQGGELPGRAFEQAVRITPFDAGAYALRALSTLAREQSVGRALPDIARALEHDPDNGDARATLARMQALSTGADPRLPLLLRADVTGEQGRLVRERIDQLAREHRITAN
jgi:tetratricopeptide (TPR) repeat protein